MIKNINVLKSLGLSLLFLFAGLLASAQVMPPKPYPPRLVNDLAHTMTDEEQNLLETKLVDFSRQTSTEITIVTIDSLGDYDVSDYAIKLGKAWGVGMSGKDNGVLLLVAPNDRKAWIAVGKGLEGVLTDAKSGMIFRNELVPAFKQGNYYEGMSKAADAIIAVTKGEYTADAQPKGTHIPFTVIIVIIVFIIFILRIFRGGGGGGGNYMSGGGLGNFATGMFLGSMLGGGRGGGWGGGDGGGGGGFGGFGGGDFGGGGAGGSW